MWSTLTTARARTVRNPAHQLLGHRASFDSQIKTLHYTMPFNHNVFLILNELHQFLHHISYTLNLYFYWKVIQSFFVYIYTGQLFSLAFFLLWNNPRESPSFQSDMGSLKEGECPRYFLHVERLNFVLKWTACDRRLLALVRYLQFLSLDGSF